jgi:hypothetical protein
MIAACLGSTEAPLQTWTGQVDFAWAQSRRAPHGDQHRQGVHLWSGHRTLKKEGKLSPDAQHRQVQYLNNRIEADHGKLKRLIKPTLGFQSLRTAFATIKGFEVMRALKKGQGSLFRYLPGVAGEVSLVHRAFGLI